MGIALRGNLQDFGIAEVFQLIGQQRKTGLLHITGKSEVRLYFDEGCVVRAFPWSGNDYEPLGQMLVRCGLLTRDVLRERVVETEASARPLPALLLSYGDVEASDLEQVEDLLTHEVIFQVLRWQEGSFHFTARAVEHDRGPERLLAAEQILMDGLRMVDEWRTFSNLVPSDAAVFGQSGKFEVYRHKASGDARGRMANAERVFQLVNGRSTARRVIDLSRLGTFDATRILVQLLEAGMIELIQEHGSDRPLSPGMSLRPFLQMAGATASSVLPLALLSAVVWIGWAQPGWVPAPPPKPGFALPDRMLGESRARFEKRRLRNAIEAHRLRHGALPPQLGALVADGQIEVDALEAARGRPYLYVRRGAGYVLLSPER